MFTAISKAFLWIGVVAGIVASIMLGSTVSGNGFWITLGCIVATLIIFSFYGMIVEISSNIKKSRKLLEEMSRNNGAQTNNVQPATNVSNVQQPVNTASVQPTVNVASVQQPVTVTNVQQPVKVANSTPSEPWVCPKCGHTNSGSYKYCEDCDARKPSNFAVQQSVDNNKS